MWHDFSIHYRVNKIYWILHFIEYNFSIPIPTHWSIIQAFGLPQGVVTDHFRHPGLHCRDVPSLNPYHGFSSSDRLQ